MPTYSSDEQEERQFSEQVGSIEPVEQQGQVMQIVTSWMRRGIEQGLTQGRVEGQRTEALALILRQLAFQVGSLSSETQQQVGQLSLIQLEILAVDLLGFKDLVDLQSWLTQNQ